MSYYLGTGVNTLIFYFHPLLTNVIVILVPCRFRPRLPCPWMVPGAIPSLSTCPTSTLYHVGITIIVPLECSQIIVSSKWHLYMFTQNLFRAKNNNYVRFHSYTIGKLYLYEAAVNSTAVTPEGVWIAIGVGVPFVLILLVLLVLIVVPLAMIIRRKKRYQFIVSIDKTNSFGPYAEVAIF